MCSAAAAPAAGGLYAAGLSADELEEVVRTSDWNVLLRDRPPRSQRSFRRKSDDLSFLVDFDLGVDSTGLLLPGGLVQGQNMDLALRRLTLPVMAVEDFDELPIPFRSVATDIGNGEMVVFDSGDLVTAMHASMAVPGIFKPERVDGRLLVDGGISSNLPIEIMRDMGADIIIAVDLGFPLQPQEKLGSALAITSQMLTILINSRAEDQLRFLEEDDIHITPDLGELGSQEFDRLAEAMEIGRRDAARHAQALARLSIPQDAYHAYREDISRRRGVPPVIDDVRVVNDSRLSPKAIETRLQPFAGEPLKLDELERNIADIYALDAFESVAYDVHQEDGLNTLEIKSKAKQWGPNYIRFGINLEDDFQGGSNYNVAARLTMTEINALGGEFRTELQVGQSPRVFTELFQPLDHRSRWFINPKLELRRTSEGIFDDGIQLAQLSSRQGSVSLEGGGQLGHWGEFRVGLLRLRSDQSLLIGEPGLEADEGNLGAWLAQLAYDTIDQVDIPLHGTLAAVAWNGSRRNIGSDGDFDVGSLFLLKPMTWGRNTLLHWWNLDATLSDDTAGIQPFTLSNTLTAGSLFVVLDTLLGPLYLGYGMGEDDRRSAFLYLGQTF